jgi:hypothetical protein
LQIFIAYCFMIVYRASRRHFKCGVVMVDILLQFGVANVGVIAAGEGLNFVTLDQAIITFVTALIGAATAWLVKRKIPPDKTPPLKEDIHLPAPSDDRESTPVVPVDRYNQVVRHYNDILRKANILLRERNEFADQAKYQRKRAERLRLNSRALRVAIYFAIISLLFAATLPSSSPPTASEPLTPGSLAQLLGLLIASLSIPAWLTRDMKNSPYRPHEIASAVGLMGLGTCGVISMAVSLPYNWARLRGLPSPIVGVHFGFFLLLLRLCVFPVLGYFGALAGFILWRRQSLVEP